MTIDKLFFFGNITSPCFQSYNKSICKCSLNMKSGNEQWKYLPFIQPPQPIKHESYGSDIKT